MPSTPSQLSSSLVGFRAFLHGHCTLCVFLGICILITLSLAIYGMVYGTRTALRNRALKAICRPPARALILPTIHADHAPDTAKTGSFTLGSLSAQTYLIITSTARLAAMTALLDKPKQLARMTMDFICHGLAHPTSWGRVAAEFFGMRNDVQDRDLIKAEAGETEASKCAHVTWSRVGGMFKSPSPASNAPSNASTPAPATPMNTAAIFDTSCGAFDVPEDQLPKQPYVWTTYKIADKYTMMDSPPIIISAPSSDALPDFVLSSEEDPAVAHLRKPDPTPVCPLRDVPLPELPHADSNFDELAVFIKTLGRTVRLDSAGLRRAVVEDTAPTDGSSVMSTDGPELAKVALVEDSKVHNLLLRLLSISDTFYEASTCSEWCARR